MRMALALSGLILLASLARGQGALAAEFRCELEAVEFGAPFELELLRAWPEDRVVADFDPAELEPLEVVELSRSRERRGDRIVERRLLRAHAFALGVVEIAPPSPREVGGGVLGRAGPALRLEVLSLLDPAAPGPMELPGRPGPVPPEPWRALVAAALVAAVLLVAALAILRSRTEAGRSGRSVDPRRRALGSLGDFERLLAADPSAAGEVEAGAVATLREWLAAEPGLPAPELSSEELLERPEISGSLSPERRLRLGELLRRADALKFGDAEGSAELGRRAIAEVRAIVEGWGS